MVFNRKTLEFLDGFGSWGSGTGQFGTLHHLSVDSKGNLYTAEVTPLKPENRRVQKFTFTGFVPMPTVTKNKYLQNFDHAGGLVPLCLNWTAARNATIGFGVDIFVGPSDGFFGRYNNRDRVYSEIRYDF